MSNNGLFRYFDGLWGHFSGGSNMAFSDFKMHFRGFGFPGLCSRFGAIAILECWHGRLESENSNDMYFVLQGSGAPKGGRFRSAFLLVKCKVVKVGC